MIDGAKALEAFRHQRESLYSLIPHTLYQMANSLYSKAIISKETYDTAINESLDMPKRTMALLDGMEFRIKKLPSDFREIVCILKSEPFLSTLADELVHSYIKLEKTSSSELNQTLFHVKDDIIGQALYSSSLSQGLIDSFREEGMQLQYMEHNANSQTHITKNKPFPTQ